MEDDGYAGKWPKYLHLLADERAVKRLAPLIVNMAARNNQAAEQFQFLLTQRLIARSRYCILNSHVPLTFGSGSANDREIPISSCAALIRLMSVVCCT